MNECYINTESYEMISHPNFFPCDKKIAPAVAKLNKLGYHTTASCEGHDTDEYYEQTNVDLDFLKRVQKDPLFIIKEIRDDGFDYLSPNQMTSIYISFKEVYSFPNLPEAFELEQKDNSGFQKCVCIRHVINFFEEDGKKKSKEIIENEIEKYCNILDKWASNLPKLEKKGD